MKGAENKVMMRDLFIDKITMEIKLDALFEMEIFACSHSALQINSEFEGMYYVQTHSWSALGRVSNLIRDQLALNVNGNYHISHVANYCCDYLFEQGYIIWHL